MTTSAEAAAALRASPHGRIVALRLAFSTVDDLAAALDGNELLVAAVMRDLPRVEARAADRSQEEAYRNLGREIVKAIRAFERSAGPGWRSG